MDRVAKISLAVALFAGLHVVATTWESVSAWGFDSLRYHSFQSTLPFCILIVLVLMRPVRTRVISLVERVPDPWCSERRIGMLTTLLMVGGRAAFLAWPSAVHLLGDGYLLLRDLPFGTSRISRVHTMAWAPPMQPWGGGRRPHPVSGRCSSWIQAIPKAQLSGDGWVREK